MSALHWLLEPKLRGIDLQGFERIALHAEILAQKPLIREVFKEFYDVCMAMDQKHFDGVAGRRVELGAGTSLFKKYYPEIDSTDVQPAPHLDAVLDAENMDLESESVRALFCINCFHHFPDPSKFFREALRVLKPGGGCVVIDPYFGMLAGILYKRLFSSEAYDREARGWGYSVQPGTTDLLPNQALSYITFFRDRAKFDALSPQLEIVETRILRNYLRYLLSGGLNFRQIIPTFAGPLLRVFEGALSPLARVFALHHVVVIRKLRLAAPTA
jgi:SAM-dependent methyltransferase